MKLAIALVLLFGGVGLFVTALPRSSPKPSLPAAADAAPSMREIAPANGSAEYLGQFDWSDPAAPRFAWPASRIRLRFNGTSIAARLGDTPVPDETPETDRLAVTIDGVRGADLALEQGTRGYVLARGLSPGVHTLVLTKLTEAEVGTVALHGFELGRDGQVLPPLPRKQRWLEVIGDSISAGYGVLGKSAACGWSATREDASRTYGAVAADALGAELLLEAWSGKGVYQNFNAHDAETMPLLFERVIPSEPNSKRATLTHVPELVVVNLGTNDLFRSKPNGRGFLDAYRALLDRVRARAPKAGLVLVVSPLIADDYPFRKARSLLRSWLEKLKAEREKRGERVVLLEQYVDPKEGLGCARHPNLATHARLARELTQVAREQFGW